MTALLNCFGASIGSCTRRPRSTTIRFAGSSTSLVRPGALSPSFLPVAMSSAPLSGSTTWLIFPSSSTEGRTSRARPPSSSACSTYWSARRRSSYSSPLCVLIGLAIKLDSRGPVLFAQARAGTGGRPFRMFKFRSMVADAEEQLHNLVALDRLPEPVFKLHGDPRVTRLWVEDCAAGASTSFRSCGTCSSGT